MHNLISVIIPCYNASQYITETITSVLLQQGVSIELIVVNDGSTDNTENKILEINSPLINYIKQENKGVSSARNLGLKNAKGTFIVFFDADDIMPSDFLYSRCIFLTHNQFEFVSGKVQKFDKNGLMTGDWRGTSNQPFDEVLCYHPQVVTCPSNYMFKYDFIFKYQIYFNEKLSSTADRFFILQCAQNGNGCYIDTLVPLHYRVSENSMSHLISKALVNDNELFYQELKVYKLIPNDIKKKTVFLGNYILAMSYLKIGNFSKALHYTFLSIMNNPVLFLKKNVSA